MLNEIEILKFEETPEAKHLGVAHVRLFRQVILRYKVQEKTDGVGYFINPPAYKREFSDGTEKWTKWHLLDSQVFQEEVRDQVESYVHIHMTNKSALSTQQPTLNPHQAPMNPPPNQGYSQPMQQAQPQAQPPLQAQQPLGGQTQYIQAVPLTDTVPF